MARSIAYWYDKIITEKNTLSSLSSLTPSVDNAQTLLNDLTTTSRVARWRLFVWAVSACAYSIDVILDLSIISFEKLSKNSRFGTEPWYVSQSLLFQYGDTVVYLNNEYQYPIIDVSKRIIKRAATKENGNIVNIKVAKLVSGVPTKLNGTEKTAFTAYMAKTKAAGVTINIISDDPDELRLYIKVKFDPLILDNTGQLLNTPGSYPVEDAINAYISNLNFNFTGTLEICDLIDKIQLAAGVSSAYNIQASARYGVNPFNVFTENYESNAGHMIIDSTNPLSSTITYQAV